MDNESNTGCSSARARPVELDEILANLQVNFGLRTQMTDYSPNH